MSKCTPICSRSKLKQLCRDVLACPSLDAACHVIEAFASRLPAYTLVRCSELGRRRRRPCVWKRDLLKLAHGLRQGRVPFQIFTKGNSKLPFWSFSTLPQFTCPGAGSCLSWCYSFTAWRNAGPFCRQLQNTLLLRWHKIAITKAWRELEHAAIFRLYVDGDFGSMDDLAYWFRQLDRRPDIRAYGYSKSWALFQAWSDSGRPFPSNYRLNLSSGSKYFDDGPVARALAELPILRGQFLCIPVGAHPKGFLRFDSLAYHRDVRAVVRRLTGSAKVFSCPGNCGKCLPDGQHACGSDRMRDVIIAIGQHN